MSPQEEIFTGGEDSSGGSEGDEELFTDDDGEENEEDEEINPGSLEKSLVPDLDFLINWKELINAQYWTRLLYNLVEKLVRNYDSCNSSGKCKLEGEEKHFMNKSYKATFLDWTRKIVDKFLVLRKVSKDEENQKNGKDKSVESEEETTQDYDFFPKGHPQLEQLKANRRAMYEDEEDVTTEDIQTEKANSSATKQSKTDSGEDTKKEKSVETAEETTEETTEDYEDTTMDAANEG